MTKIANHTTSVPVPKTIGEITSLLVEHGARSIHTDYENMEAKAIRFEIVKPEFSMVFVLPCDWRATHKILNDGRSWRAKEIPADQARRVAWRVLRDWLRAQLTLIEIGAAKLEQVMLPYAVTSEDGTTVYQRFVESKFKGLALPPAGGGA